MKFLCYDVYSGNPEDKSPVRYCIVGDGKIFADKNSEELRQKILASFPEAEFLDNCGWILSGEERDLLEPDNYELLRFNIKLRHPDTI